MYKPISIATTMGKNCHAVRKNLPEMPDCPQHGLDGAQVVPWLQKPSYGLKNAFMNTMAASARGLRLELAY